MNPGLADAWTQLPAQRHSANHKVRWAQFQAKPLSRLNKALLKDIKDILCIELTVSVCPKFEVLSKV